MGRVSTAFRAFFGSLFDKRIALRVTQALNDQQPTAKEAIAHLPTVAKVPTPELKKPSQSEAITLLATLQREARLVDFLKEDLGGYSDEQVGAAVREIHRECGSVLNRFFAIQPVMNDDEGATVVIPAGFDATRFRLTGKVTDNAPFRGVMRHHGWEATQCELPTFTGSDSGARVIAPAELELH